MPSLVSGALMANEDVPKILLKAGGEQNVAQAFKTFSRLDVKVANIFDIESAAKFLDYAECGQSVFTSAGKKIQRLAAKYGLPDSTADGKVVYFEISHCSFYEVSFQVEWCYLTFLHLTSILPPCILSLLEEKSKLEVGIASYQVCWTRIWEILISAHLYVPLMTV